MRVPLSERTEAQHKWVDNFEWKHIKPKTAPPQGGRAKSDGWRDSNHSRSRRTRYPRARVRYEIDEEDPGGSSAEGNRRRRYRKGGRRNRRKRSPSSSRSRSPKGGRNRGTQIDPVALDAQYFVVLVVAVDITYPVL